MRSVAANATLSRLSSYFMPPLVLTSDQASAVAGILEDIRRPFARIVLCGYAGTGKTVTTAALVSKLRSNHFTVVVATPTHKARSQVEKALKANGAKDFQCLTVHRLLGLKQIRDYDTGKESFLPDKNGKNLLADGIFDGSWDDFCETSAEYNSWSDYRSQNSSAIDIVIVDETSMVHEDLYRYLCSEAGSRPIVFVGDDRQLLPVKESQPCAAFVEAESVYRLNKVLRHDGVILNLATKTRSLPAGRAKFVDAIGGGSQVVAYHRRDQWIDSLCEMMASAESINDIDYCRALAFTNRTVNNLNQRIHARRYGANAPQYLSGMACVTVDAIADPTGGAPLLNSTVEVYVKNAEIELFRAPGDDLSCEQWRTWILDVEPFYSDGVLQIRVLDNSEEQRWQQSQRLFANNARHCDDPGERRELWKIFYQRQDQLGKIQPASALTIHKSQGSTFEHVFLHWDIDGWGSAPSAQQNQLAYVGITRASQTLHVIKDK